jgi:O-antigen/teichoic acid export membrane protein
MRRIVRHNECVSIEDGQTQTVASGRALRANFALALAGLGTYALAQWLIVSFLAHLGGPLAVGQFSLGMAIAGPLATLSMLASRTLLQTRDRPGSFKDLWHLRLITTVMFLVVMLCITLIRGDPIELAVIIMLLGAYKAVECLSDLTYGVAQATGHDRIMSTSFFLRGVLGFLAFATAFVATRSLPIALAVLALVAFAIFWFHDWPRTSLHQGPLLPWDRDAVWSIACRCAPLGVAMFINTFNIVIPRLFLEYHAGLEALGVFSALAYLITVGNIVVAAMGNTMLTPLARHWDEGDFAGFTSATLKATATLAGLSLAGIVICWLAGPRLLAVLYGPDFVEYANLLIVVAAGGSFLLIGNFLGYAMMATKTFALQLPLNVVALAAVLIASTALIPVRGARGAAEAILILGATKILTAAFNAHYAYARRGQLA